MLAVLKKKNSLTTALFDITILQVLLLMLLLCTMALMPYNVSYRNFTNEQWESSSG